MRFLSALVILSSGCALIDAAGDGGGGLTHRKANIPNTTAAPRASAIANLDGMLGPDVVVVDETGRLIGCPSQSEPGTFDQHVTTFTGYTTVTALDLDGDGTTEVLAAGPGVLDVLVPDTSPEGFKRIALTAMTLDGTHTPRTLTAGNVPNGSVSRSVVISYADSPEVRVIANPLASATFTSLTMTMPPADLVVADVSSGVPGDELVVSDQLAVAQFSGPALDRSDQTVGNGSAQAFAIGEFGGGPEADVAYLRLSEGPGDIGILGGSPTGLFDPGTHFGSGTAGDDLASGDFNGDGQDDLAVLYTENAGSRRIRLFLGTASASTFGQDELVLDGHPTSFAVGDLDGDGISDFVLTPGSAGGVDLLLSH
jgi:hypothetical protein